MYSNSKCYIILCHIEYISVCVGPVVDCGVTQTEISVSSYAPDGQTTNTTVSNVAPATGNAANTTTSFNTDFSPKAGKTTSRHDRSQVVLHDTITHMFSYVTQ